MVPKCSFVLFICKFLQEVRVELSGLLFTFLLRMSATSAASAFNPIVLVVKAVHSYFKCPLEIIIK